jgi:D-beta-D-heptose 7-phosphate kinase/D-beta-D-heptose 1-phosphate adenosyltransferase
VRFVSEHHSTHLLRADWEVAASVSAEMERSLIEAASSLLRRADAVVLSDYAKGVLSPGLIRAVSPNRKELADASRRAVANGEDIAAAAHELCGRIESEAVLVTRSEEGMTLCARSGEALHVPAYPAKVRDVSGAGDTVAAVLAVMLANGSGFERAARAANAAGAVVVGKRGTATVSLSELRSRLLPAASLASEEKTVFDWAELDDHLGEWRRLGRGSGSPMAASISCIQAT